MVEAVLVIEGILAAAGALGACLPGLELNLECNLSPVP